MNLLDKKDYFYYVINLIKTRKKENLLYKRTNLNIFWLIHQIKLALDN